MYVPHNEQQCMLFICFCKKKIVCVLVTAFIFNSLSSVFPSNKKKLCLQYIGKMFHIFEI